MQLNELIAQAPAMGYEVRERDGSVYFYHAEGPTFVARRDGDRFVLGLYHHLSPARRRRYNTVTKLCAAMRRAARNTP